MVSGRVWEGICGARYLMGLIALNFMAMLILFQAAARWPWEPQWPKYILWVFLGVLIVGEVLLFMRLPPRPPGIW